MKTKFLFVLAAAAMLFTACKDPNSNDNNSLEKRNELIMNGEKHELTSSYGFNDSVFFFNAATLETNENGVALADFFAEGNLQVLNNTIDLSKAEDLFNYELGLDYRIDWSKAFRVSHYPGFWGGIGDAYYENTSIFKSGTLQTIENNEGAFFILNGVLLTDDTVEIYLYVPKEEFYNR